MYYHTNERYRKYRAKTSRERIKNGKYYDWLYNTEAGKNSQKKSKQAAKEKEHVITENEWKACKDYFDNKCAYCGMSLEEHYMKRKGKIILSDFHKEHVIHKGRNDIKNCVPSCKICNSTKHDNTLNEFFNSFNPNYTFEKYHRIYTWIRYDCLNYIERKYEVYRKRY